MSYFFQYQHECFKTHEKLWSAACGTFYGAKLFSLLVPFDVHDEKNIFPSNLTLYQDATFLLNSYEMSNKPHFEVLSRFRDDLTHFTLVYGKKWLFQIILSIFLSSHFMDRNECFFDKFLQKKLQNIWKAQISSVCIFWRKKMFSSVFVPFHMCDQKKYYSQIWPYFWEPLFAS